MAVSLSALERFFVPRQDKEKLSISHYPAYYCHDSRSGIDFMNRFLLLFL